MFTDENLIAHVQVTTTRALWRMLRSKSFNPYVVPSLKTGQLIDVHTQKHVGSERGSVGWAKHVIYRLDPAMISQPRQDVLSLRRCDGEKEAEDRDALESMENNLSDNREPALQGAAMPPVRPPVNEVSMEGGDSGRDVGEEAVIATEWLPRTESKRTPGSSPCSQSPPGSPLQRLACLCPRLFAALTSKLFATGSKTALKSLGKSAG